MNYRVGTKTGSISTGHLERFSSPHPGGAQPIQISIRSSRGFMSFDETAKMKSGLFLPVPSSPENGREWVPHRLCKASLCWRSASFTNSPRGSPKSGPILSLIAVRSGGPFLRVSNWEIQDSATWRRWLGRAARPPTGLATAGSLLRCPSAPLSD
jgi:hypothetical protein